jgi:hypothetical protein
VGLIVAAVETVKAQLTSAPTSSQPTPDPSAPGPSAPEPPIAATAPATPSASAPIAYAAPHGFSGRETNLSPQQLQALVGRIAIYPDDLLGLVLTAATQPVEIVEAQRFLQARKTHPALKPVKTWDPSVVALLNYPDVLKQMDTDLTWTEQLGTSVIEQRAAVLDAIQEFRKQAYDAGNLRSNDKQTVTVSPDGAGDTQGRNGTIAIWPANPQLIYVPIYEPAAIVAPLPTDDGSAYDWSPAYPYYGDSDAPFFPELWYGGFIGFGFGWRDHQIYCGDGHHGHGGDHDHDHGGVDRDGDGRSHLAQGATASGRTIWEPGRGAVGQIPVRVTGGDLAGSGSAMATAGARLPPRPVVIRPTPQMTNGGAQVNQHAEGQAFHSAPTIRNGTAMPRGSMATRSPPAVMGGFAGAGSNHH